MKIRKARASEAGNLSSLALRSKGYWPYAKDQLLRYQEQLKVFAEEIEAG